MRWLHLPFEWIEKEPNPKNCAVRLIEDGKDKGYIWEPGPSKEPLDAVESAMRMLKTPTGKLPSLARRGADRLVAQTGLCLEVLITAYAYYNQAVRGMRCEDPAYRNTPDFQKWFDEQMAKTLP